MDNPSLMSHQAPIVALYSISIYTLFGMYRRNKKYLCNSQQVISNLIPYSNFFFKKKRRIGGYVSVLDIRKVTHPIRWPVIPSVDWIIRSFSSHFIYLCNTNTSTSYMLAFNSLEISEAKHIFLSHGSFQLPKFFFIYIF